MGSYWAVVPISVLACGFLAVLIYDRFLDRPAPALVSIAPTFFALIVTLSLFFTSTGSFDLTLLFWPISVRTGTSLALIYYVDAWGLLTAALAVFLALCGQLIVVIGQQRSDEAHSVASSESKTSSASFLSGANQNWSQIVLLAGLMIVLNLAFTASLVVFFVSWCVLGFLAYLVVDAGYQEEQAFALGLTIDTIDNSSTEERPESGHSSEAAAALDAKGRSPEAAPLKYLAAFGLLGVVVMLSREDQGTALAISLRTGSLGLTSSILLAAAVGSFLGLYPFASWQSTRFSHHTAVAAPIGVLPALAAFYLLGRLYPTLVAQTAPSFSSVLGLLGIVTVIVAAARAWKARALASLLSCLTALELGLVAIAFALADLHVFPAAILIFINCVLASQSVALSNALMGSQAAPQRIGSRFLLFVGPLLSLIGLPFTLGFMARWMLLAASPNLRLLVLWPVIAVATGVGAVATFRLLDGTMFNSAKSGAGLSAGATDPSVDRLVKIGAGTVSLLPWLISLALGLVPNQVAYWITAPAAGAVLGDEYEPLFAARMALPDSYLTAIALTFMLAVVILAFYVHSLPIARFAAKIPSLIGNDSEGRTELRHKMTEVVLDLTTTMVVHASELDGILERMWRGISNASSLIARLHDSLYEDYCFPSLAVLGLVILFVFLG